MNTANKSTAKGRTPRAIKLDDPDASEKPNPSTDTSGKNSSPKRRPKSFSEKTKIRETPDEAAQRVSPLPSNAADLELAESLTPTPAVNSVKRVFRWGRLFWVALFGLISLSLGLWIDELITSLFARNNWLGWAASGFAGLLVLASIALAMREFWGISRMAKISQLRSDAAEVRANDDMAGARNLATQLDKLYSNRPDTARSRNQMQQHREQIIDGCDLIDLIERDLMTSLDQRSRSLVMGSAKRVSVVTAVSPRALIDIGYVLYENLKLIRQIAELYGGRPGSVGFWRLTRNVVGHLAVTGTIAVGDGLMQQLVGQGVAAKLSSRLGEGVINGMLTARIGIAAIDLCRPLPFSDQTRLSVSDFIGELVSLGNKKGKNTEQ